jgi:hypothetical protein
MWLLIGPLVLPVPAPLPVAEALDKVDVDVSRDRSGFQLAFTIGKTSPLQLALLPLGFFEPMVTRVVILVVIKGLPHVIMDGVVTRQELQPGNAPGESKLTITGEDLSVLMDVVEVRLPFLGMPDAARINLILAKYLAFGIVPVVVPPPVLNADSPTSRFDTQMATDRAYVREVAAQSGYVFYIEPGPLPGQSIAYFGPDIRPPPIPQRALSVNLDAETNVERISFAFDGLAKKTTLMFLLDPVTHKVALPPVPIPGINPLRPPLGIRPAVPARISFAADMARLSPTEAAKRALGIANQSVAPIKVTGALDVAAYGAPLKARGLVGLRGAGFSYDGLYYVDSVTHSIKRGEYKQNFELSRDGLGALAPVVVP